MTLSLTLMTACIHTYPTPEDAVDPTEIDVEMVFEFNESWEAINIGFQPDQSQTTRGEKWPRRLYVELQRPSGEIERLTRTIMPGEIKDNKYNLTLPNKLKATRYRVMAWSDYLHPDTMEPLGYDITDTGMIRELNRRGMESESRLCLTGYETIDLADLAGHWNATERIDVTLTPPMARLRIIAEDYSEFLEYVSTPHMQGEKYYVALRYETDIPGLFNLYDNDIIDPMSDCEFSLTLPVITTPGIQMCIASDWFFNPSRPHKHSVTITLYDSAKMVVSEMKGVEFTAERGKVTTVTGRFLTNFISGGIKIDNIWAGEIIIPLD